VIHFIEPVSIIEQDTGYVNSDGSVPIGFTVWDDSNNILMLKIGIVGYNNYQCLAQWEYDENSNALTNPTSSDGKNCGLEETERSIRFQENKPPFFEFDLAVDGENVKRVNDAYYDVTIMVTDGDQNQAEPQTRRFKFGENIKDKYNDMLVCLGSADCSTAFADSDVNEDVEDIATGSTATTAAKADQELSTIEESELQTIE
jgi:hypothetical protein